MDEALAAFGLVADPGESGGAPPDDKCYLWPCNVPTFMLWQQVQTQWRIGMDGRSGLDYTAVNSCMREVLRIKPKDHTAMFRGVQAMEFAALDVWAEKK